MSTTSSSSTSSSSSFSCSSSDLQSISSLNESSPTLVSLEQEESIVPEGELAIDSIDESSIEIVNVSNESFTGSNESFNVSNESFNASNEPFNGSNESTSASLNCFLFTPGPSDTSEPPENPVPAPPPSWTTSVEAFINQLNDLDYSYDHGSETFELVEFSVDGGVDSEGRDAEFKGENGFLAYWAVPVLLSHLLMLLIVTHTSTSTSANVNYCPVPIVTPAIYAIHHHHNHHHHYYYHYYSFSEEKNSDGSFSKRFFHIFFNPFSIISNSKFYKTSSRWFTEQGNDPSTLIGQFFKYLKFYLGYFQAQFNRLADSIHSGLESEIGNSLKFRDKWNKAVYDKIYKIAASPQFKRAVSTVSKWASAIKDRLFSSN